MMEAAFRPPTEGLPDWIEPSARTIGAARKYFVSSTLERVDWNAELVRASRAEFGSGAVAMRDEAGR